MRKNAARHSRKRQLRAAAKSRGHENRARAIEEAVGRIRYLLAMPCGRNDVLGRMREATRIADRAGLSKELRAELGIRDLGAEQKDRRAAAAATQALAALLMRG